jgi:hypothetical protein
MKSNTPVALVALIAAVAGAAFSPAALAQSGEQLSSPDYSPAYIQLKSLRTRADVHAEAVAAARNDRVWSGEQNEVPYIAKFVSKTTRAEVAAAAREANRLGRIGYNGEAQPAPAADTPQRAIVLAGVRAAPSTLVAAH